MAEFAVHTIMLVAPETVAVRLKGILEDAGYALDIIAHTGEQAIRAAQDGHLPGLLVTTYRLPDMTGLSLIRELGELGGALLIAPQGVSQEGLPECVVPLSNPINREAFLQSVAVLLRMNERILRLGREVNRLTRTLDERKVIERAKGMLMDSMHMSEAEAHRRMQKISMDSGKRLYEVACGILEPQASQAG